MATNMRILEDYTSQYTSKDQNVSITMQRSSSMVQAGARNDNLYVVEQGNGDYLESLVQENDVEYMRELYVWDKSPCSLCMGCFCDLMCHWNIGSRNTKWL